MIVSPRAATQLHALEPEAVAAILDSLRDRTMPPGATITETRHGAYGAFIARHKDGSMVLVSITVHGRNRHGHDD